MASRTARGPTRPRRGGGSAGPGGGEALARPESRAVSPVRVEKKTVDVPDRAVPLIAELMDKLGAGESVEVRTVHDTLSTTEAAEILNVLPPRREAARPGADPVRGDRGEPPARSGRTC